MAARSDGFEVAPVVVLNTNWTVAGIGITVRRSAGTAASSAVATPAVGANHSACTSPLEKAASRSDWSPRRRITVAGCGGVPQYLSLRDRLIWPVIGS